MAWTFWIIGWILIALCLGLFVVALLINHESLLEGNLVVAVPSSTLVAFILGIAMVVLGYYLQ